MAEKEKYLRFNGVLEKAKKDEYGNYVILCKSEKKPKEEGWDKDIFVPTLHLFDKEDE